MILQDLWRKGHDSHEMPSPQFSCYRPEYSRSDRLQLVRQQHRRITIESNHRTVRSSYTLSGTYHNCIVQFSLSYLSAWDGLFNRNLNNIPYPRISAF